MITIKCDYSLCGRIYPDYSPGKVYTREPDFPIPGEIGLCPRCNGTGKIDVDKDYLFDKIKQLQNMRDIINKQINEHYNYLYPSNFTYKA